MVGKKAALRLIVLLERFSSLVQPPAIPVQSFCWYRQYNILFPIVLKQGLPRKRMNQGKGFPAGDPHTMASLREADVRGDAKQQRAGISHPGGTGSSACRWTGMGGLARSSDAL